MSCQKLTERMPRRVENLLDSGARFVNVSVFGTGSEVKGSSKSQQGVKYGHNDLVSGTSGRAFSTVTVNVTAGEWYCFSASIHNPILGATTDCGFRVLNGTASVDLGGGSIGSSKVSGDGRYGICFRVGTSGTIRLQYGVGMSGNKPDISFRLSELQFEKINSITGICPSEYVFAGRSMVFNTLRCTSIDEKGRVTQSKEKLFVTPDYSRILLVGDSRSSDISKIGGILNGILSSESRGCAWHAKGGWTTSDILGPTLDAATPGITYTIEKALTGQALRQTISTNGEDQAYHINNNQEFDTLIISDLGVNDINGGKKAEEAMINIVKITEAGIKQGVKIVMTDNNPCLGGPISAGEVVQVKKLNRMIQTYCEQNGHLFIEIYSILGDSSNQDKLSDGAGSTPNYSADGLHPNLAGITLIANRIKEGLDLYRLNG